ncbi:MAG: hypothetical protein J0L93_09905 [Deltaproteobacteria bacterium]|nr:hypothetical protein [Deltaproteobacteria bacterium]
MRATLAFEIILFFLFSVEAGFSQNLSPTLAPSPETKNISLDNWFERWGLSVVQKPLRHRFETATFKPASKNLELKVWMEAPAKFSGGTELFCNISYNLIFGRVRLQNKVQKVPLDAAFSELPKIDSVTLTYFLVDYVNRPNRSSASAPSPKLRVMWSREERIIPYLTMTITRKEWEAIKPAMKLGVKTTFTHYMNQYCESVLKQSPEFYTDLSALKEAAVK